ncbi:putative ribonuclease H-like domain-containing protein, partial [Tanacetum coccineum]
SFNTAIENINTGSLNINTASPIPNDPCMQSLEDTGIFDDAYDDREEVGVEADLNNLVTTMNVNSIPTTRIHKDHLIEQIIRDLHSAPLTRRMSQQDLEELVRNKARLVAQDYTQEEGIHYDEVFAPVARIEAIRYMLMISSLGLQRRLQVQQKEDGIFISQDKYVADILKKFDLVTVKASNTPIETNKALLKDEEAEDVDVHLYRSMIGSLMYLTASRPDIMFAVCACARFQVTPKTSHLHAVKRIFRYLKGQPKLGLWYPRDSPFDLEAFSDSDYAGASLDRKSTTGGCQFLGKRLISWQCKKQTIVANSTTKAEYVAAANCYETVYKEWEDRMERAATTASSLEAKQDIGNINRTQSMATLNESFPQGTDSEQFWQTASANTLENGDIEITATIDGKVKVVSEASIRRHLKLKDYAGISTLPTSEIFEQSCSNGGQILQGDGSTIPVESHHTPISAPSTSQPPTSPPSMQTTHVAEEVATMPHDLPLLRGYSLRSDKGKVGGSKVKSSKARRRVRLVVSEDEDELEDPSKQGRKIAQIDEDKGITLVQMSAQTQRRHEHDFEESNFEFIAPEEDYTAEPDISTANVPVSTASAEVSTANPEVKTAVESLVYIRRSAAKRKDKGKAIMKEAEPVQKKTKLQLEQERLGLKEALRLQEQLDEKERKMIARVHEEASTFNAEEWNNIQAQIEADEKKREFAQQRAEQRRNKPMTHAQQRTYMFQGDYLRPHMKRVNTFTPIESDDTVPKVVAGSSKIDAEQELNQENSKRQKIGEGSEPAEESKYEQSQEQL